MHFTGLALFDMDGVLTSHRSSWRAVNEFLGTDNSANLKAYRGGNISYHEFIKRDTALWLSAKADLKNSDIISVMSEISLTKGINAATKRLREEGLLLSIVSGGLSELADIIRKIGLFDEVYANKLRYDSSGTLLPDGEPVVLPEQKDIIVRKLQQKYSIPKERTAAVGDARIDLSMFKESKYSISFNSTEPEINAYCDIVINSDNLMDAATAIISLLSRA